jgi:hypothetical protein
LNFPPFWHRQYFPKHNAKQLFCKIRATWSFAQVVES